MGRPAPALALALALAAAWAPADAATADGRRPAAARFDFERLTGADGLTQNSVLCSLEDRLGFLWFGTFDGLNKYDGTGFKTYRYEPSEPDSLSDSTILALLEDTYGDLWIGTISGGLNRFDRRSERFTRYRSDPGDPASLPHDTVWGLMETRSGELYVATSGGLAHLDRRSGEFTRFASAGDGTTGPAYRVVYALLEDRAGNIWVGSGSPGEFRGGLDRFDPRTGSFTRQPLSAQPTEPVYAPVTALMEDDRGRIWAASTGDGLFRFDPATGEAAHFAPEHPTFSAATLAHLEGLRRAGRVEAAILGPTVGEHRSQPFELAAPAELAVSALGEGFGGMLYDYGWIARRDTQEVVWQMDLEHTRFAGGHFKNRRQLDLVTLTPGAYELHYRADSSHGYGAWNTRAPNEPEEWGIQLLRPEAADLAHLRATLAETPPAGGDSFPGNDISALAQEPGGRIWIGARRSIRDGGLASFDPGTGVFTRHLPRRGAEIASIASLLVDRTGVLWAGTILAGVLRHDPARVRFATYSHDPARQDSLGSNFVSCFLEDARGNLWVGTQGGGLNLFERAAGTFERVGGNDFVTSIAEDGRGQIWVASPGPSLSVIDPATRQAQFKDFATIEQNPAGLSDADLRVLHVDREGRLWVGTGNGLNRLLPDGSGFERYLPPAPAERDLYPAEVLTLCDGEPGELWIGTSYGLARMDVSAGRFTWFRFQAGNPDGLPHNRVTALHYQPDGGLWAGTGGGGLVHLAPRAASFTRFTSRDGLANNSIAAIVPDQDGHLWVSSLGGLSRFDPVRRTFVNYDAGDGLQSNQFHSGAALATRDGELLFGGYNGFSSFRPADIRPDPHVPPVVITAVRAFDRTLRRDVTSLESIELSHRDSYVAFEFVALDYSNPEKNQYSYRLVGFDPDWIQAGNRRFASYTNLPGGSYLFQVRGASSDGIWNERGASVRIAVDPPPWATTWAYTLYVLGGFALLAAALAVVRYREREKASLREAELKAQAAAAQTRLIEADHRRKTEELERARVLQLSMLPSSPVQLPGLELAVFMRTATEVGGDYYDFIPQGDGSLVLVTGDATGHGLSAGMMVSMTKASLHALGRQPPDEILRRLNRGIKEAHTGSLKMALNILHIHAGQVEFSSAGMPPPLVFRRASGEVEERLLPELPLGSLDDITYPLGRFDFEVGDAVVLLSDGLPETRNLDEQLLGYEAIKRCVAERGREPVQKLLDALVELGEEWSEGLPNDDDVTVLVVRRTA